MTTKYKLSLYNMCCHKKKGTTGIFEIMENLICSRVSVFLFVFVVAFFVLAVRSWEWGGLDWESLELKGLDWEPSWGELA